MKHKTKTNKFESAIKPKHILIFFLCAYAFNFVATTLTVLCLEAQECVELNPRQVTIQQISPYLSYGVNGVLLALLGLTYYAFARLWPEKTIYLLPALLFVVSFTFLDMFNDVLVTLDTHHDIAYGIQRMFGF